MRKLLSLFAIAALLCAVTGTAQAGTFVPAESEMNIQLNALAPSIIQALPGTEGQVSLTDNGVGGHDLTMGATVWSTINFGRGTSLFTGVPVMTNIKVTVKNAAATYTSDFTYTNYAGDGGVKGPYLGAVAPINGQLVVWALGVPAIFVDLALFGGPAGATVHPTLLGIPMSVTGGPWATGALTITGITTNVISLNGVIGAGINLQPDIGESARDLSTGGGFVSTNDGLPLELHTVTIPGSNNLISSSQAGTVTLVAPMRINTSPAVAGRLPMAVRMTLEFVPEPGTMLLLVAGAVGLVVVGRRQLRK
jgi:hypothetical protein